MRRGLTVLLVFQFVAITAISASPQSPAKPKISPTLSLTDPGAWKSVQKGVEIRKITLERTEPGYTLDLKLLRFDTQWDNGGLSGQRAIPAKRSERDDVRGAQRCRRRHQCELL